MVVIDYLSQVISSGQWRQYAQGLGRTLIIAACATLIGILIGLIVSVIKVAAVNNRKLLPLQVICDIYLTVIRGTPVVVQLMLLYFVVFASLKNPMPAAIVGFGINSGAYVAEIFRSGILSINKGQSEAGRSLGLTSGQTMRLIILPQAIKNILPALFNEFIVLLKETSIAGYIAVQDLTKISDVIRGRTYSTGPLYIAAVLYLILVLGLSQVQKLLERRLRKGDKR